MARLSILSLGTLHITLDAVPLTTFSTDKAQALLAYLAIESERAHSRGQLASLFWPEYPERRARHSLSQALHNVRHILGDRDDAVVQPYLDVNRNALQFHSDSDYWLDMEQFRFAHAHTHVLQTSPHGLEALENALALYRGPFLDGISITDSPAFEEWLLLQRERLERRMRDMLDALVEAHIESQTLDQALHYAWRKLDLDPWREDAHRQVMRLLSATGKRSAALEQYQHCVTLLRDELGVEPEPETTALYTHLQAEHAPILPSATIDKESEASQQHNLPVLLTPFVGRDTDRDALVSLVQQAEARLITVTGSGGCGKTRLALEAAWAMNGHFPHGIWFVPMASIDSTPAVITAIANALSVPLINKSPDPQADTQPQSPLEQLQGILRNKTLLLVLDNAEHLLKSHAGQWGLADLLITLLEQAPHIKIIATSRSVIHTAGEVVFLLQSLPYPVDLTEPLDRLREHSTVQLFIHAARRVRPNFTLAERNCLAVATICNYVQGCPLATLLAASWTATLATAEIADMLTHPSSDDLTSLDLLQSEWQDFPERHRDLRSVYEHSWRLLTPKAQRVFAICSLFRGGLTRREAGEIAGANAFDLRSLVEASLITRQPSGRYVIHELLRQFGEEKLSRDPIVWRNARARYTEYYVAALEQWVKDAKGPRQQVMLEELDVEYDNVRPVWYWAVEDQDADTLLRMREGLRYYLGRRWRDEEISALCTAAMQRFEPLLQQGDADGVIVELLAFLAIFSAFTVPYMEIKALLERAECLLARPEVAERDTRFAHVRLHDMWAYYYMQVDRAKAVEHFKTLIDLYRDLGEGYRWNLGWTLLNIGAAGWHLGDIAMAAQYYGQAAGIAHELQDPRMIARITYTDASIAMTTGRLADALRLSEAYVEMCRHIGDLLELCDSLYSLGFKYLMVGQFTRASELIGESREILWNKYGQIGVLHNSVLGWIRALNGDYVKAEQLQFRAMEGLEINPWPRAYAWTHLILGLIYIAQDRLDEAITALNESVATYTPLDQGMELANAHSMLGHAYALSGDLISAKAHVVIGARTGIERQLPLSVLWALPCFTVIVVEEGLIERAVALHAAALTVPMFANAQWFQDVVGKHVEAAAAHLPPDVIQAAQSRGRALSIPDVVQVLVQELGG